MANNVIGAGIVYILYFLLAISFQATSIVAGDSGDLLTAAATFGVPHPPGYPLYTFLGWIVSRIPLSTIAWRITLLSSLSHALSLGVLYVLTSKLTRKRIAALFSVSLLGGNYLFFHYSVTPEVFGMLSFFISVTMFILYQLHVEFRPKIFVALCFLFGLSLSHHHIILFLVPAGLILLFSIFRKQKIPFTWKYILSCFIAFTLGLLPYIYVVIAAYGRSMIIWNTPNTLANFIRLITRADYGTFLSNAMYGQTLYMRFLQLDAYVRFLIIDFTLVGVILVSIGFVVLWRTNRRWFWFQIIAFLSIGPGFLFYASFPLLGRFGLGTYERFLLPSYIILTPVIGVGFASAVSILVRLLSYISTQKSMKRILTKIVPIVLFLPVVSVYFMTIWRFWGLPLDRTAEYLGRDLIEPLPENSILLLSNDTPLFIGQYVSYVLTIRPDVIVIHFSRLPSRDYRVMLARHFPDLVYPTTSSVVSKFAVANAKNRPIFSNREFAVDKGWAWVPYGLTYQLMEEKNIPTKLETETQNDAIWSRLHDPTTGILSRYNHLMLSDVRNVYGSARLDYGRMLLRVQNSTHAKKQFLEVIRLGGDLQAEKAYMYIGLAELFSDNCDEALSAFDNARRVSITPNDALWLYEGTTYQRCYKDEVRAKPLLDEYERRKKSGETKLE